MNLREYIFNKSTPEPNTGCWIWPWLSNDGYGLDMSTGETKRAHRLSYEVFKGEIPKNMWVLHKCDTPSCVNPDHLFIGTPSDNSKDMQNKKRSAMCRYPDKYIKKGMNHKDAILTDDAVRYIRKEYRPYNRLKSCAALGKKFGVSEKSIHQVISMKTWKQVI
jgi:hypothetical protein